MSRTSLSLAFVIASYPLVLVMNVDGYDLRTHSIATEQALGGSRLTAAYLRSVGLMPSDIFDREARTAPPRLAGYANTGTALGWLVEGAIREDDFKTTLVGCDPPQNPPTPIDRIRNHFFDVQRGGEGLHVPGLVSGLPAPRWALGEVGHGGGPEDNEFALPDARLHQLRSLTEPSRPTRDRHAALMFRSLGQVLHLLEDMAQPQHTRNDLHPGCENALSGRVLPERSWYEAYVEHRALGTVFRGRPTVPLQLAGAATPRPDTFSGFFAASDRAGLADFSSRNFFTSGTNLGGVLNPCTGLAEPACNAEIYDTRDVPHVVVTAKGDVLSAPVRLLLRTMRDPVTGTPIPDVAVSTRSVWDHHLEQRGSRPAFSLNILNYDAMAAVLLPRAVAYGTGLLDHFFRGRLDASVHPADGDDPAVLRLLVRNLADEALDGTVTVMAEDTTTRIRQAVLAPGEAGLLLGPVPTGPVAPGNLLPEIRFRPPFAADRYVVAYQGTLGTERPDTPPGSMGAVAGQVIGGPRAEALVPDGDGAVLRGVDGTFPLPADASGLDAIQWSDTDNHFVGLTGEPLVNGRPGPDEVRLFRLERPVGSRDIPLVPGSDQPIVAATLAKRVPFPYGLALPVIVDYAQQVRVQEPLITYERRVMRRWNEAVEGYEAVGEEIGPAGLEVAVDETITFAERFPVVLDRDHLFGFRSATPRPYHWHVVEVGQDARERLVAVVQIEFTRPTDAERTVTLRARNHDCSDFEPRGSQRVSGFVQAGGMIALIDLERGEVIGSTATALYAPSSVELAQVFPLLQERNIVTQVGGPNAGVEIVCSDSTFFGADDLPTDLTGTLTLPLVGVAAFATPGLYRADIAAEASTSPATVTTSREFELIYARSVDGVNKAVTVTSQSSALSGPVTFLREGLRMRPGTRTSSEVLLRFERPRPGADPGAVLVRWSPESPGDTRRAGGGELEPGRYQLKGATPDGAMLIATDRFESDPRTLVVNFNGINPAPFAGDLSTEFVLLPGAGLYNVNDTHFYTRDTLTETALPLALAPGPSALPPFGDYHLIAPGGS
jgi:hypothetical protein